jgi:hypothetical protein
MRSVSIFYVAVCYAFRRNKPTRPKRTCPFYKLILIEKLSVSNTGRLDEFFDHTASLINLLQEQRKDGNDT